MVCVLISPVVSVACVCVNLPIVSLVCVLISPLYPWCALISHCIHGMCAYSNIILFIEKSCEAASPSLKALNKHNDIWTNIKQRALAMLFVQEINACC